MLELLKINEYATIKNQSIQNIYAKISRETLKCIIQEDTNGKKQKYIQCDLTKDEIKRLNAIRGNIEEPEEQEPEEQDEIIVNNNQSLNDNERRLYENHIKTLKNTITLLENQLISRNNEIENKSKEIKELIDLINHYQLIDLNTIKTIQIQAPAEEQEQTNINYVEVKEEPIKPAEEPEIQAQAPEEHKGILRKIIDFLI